jgi:uncharacterized protein (DUF1501 family)
MNKRRIFLKDAGLVFFAMGLGGVPGFLKQAAARAVPLRPGRKKKVLVFLFQRGAMDGLMAVSPFTDTHLRSARPGLFMEATKQAGQAGLADLDGRFGLHPSFSGFLPLFKEGRLAIVHGMGSPNTTRSHFDAQDYMESGTPFSKGTDSGWLNRVSGMLGADASPLRAVSLTAAMPRSLYGDNDALAISGLQDLAIGRSGNPSGSAMAARSFEELYDHTTSELLNKTGKESFDAMKMLGKNDLKNYRPAPGVNYPESALGRSLLQIAQLIKLDLGLQVAFAESGGWDTHFNQGTANGIFARNAADFSKSVLAFWNDLGSWQEEVCVLSSTEFGRTVKQNGSGGTDHGRASCAFVIGNNIRGGKVLGEIGSLAPDQLADGRDLPVTTDFRSLFSGVAAGHLGLRDSGKLFPGWEGDAMNLMR